MYRHGDVIILAPIKVPSGAKPRRSNVVAEGEATGHAHRLDGGEVMESPNATFACLLRCGNDAKLTHEEHNTCELEPTKQGMVYPVILQREYDDEKEWRQVTD